MTHLPLFSLLRLVCVAALLALSVPGQATVAVAPAPIAGGSAEPGNSINEESCADCGARRYGGVANRYYFRIEQRARSRALQVAENSYCSAESGSGYFPE